MAADPSHNDFSDRIRLVHGAGGSLSRRLTQEVFLPEFSNPALDALSDGAVLKLPDYMHSGRLVIATDSHVIRPLFFPGGDIGSLSIYGTVNDLAVSGAVPLYLTASFIIEEGFLISDLKKLAYSMSRAARECGVMIVTGDTKVVEKGAADGVYINTAGVGLLREEAVRPDDHSAPDYKEGDAIILSGSLGDHGAAVFSVREDIGFKTSLRSDSGSVLHMIDALYKNGISVRIMRDPTRGGLATILNELMRASPFSAEIMEDQIPVKEEVKAVCSLVGFDPLYMANEGKFVSITAKEDADKAVSLLRNLPGGEDAAVIGRLTRELPGKVLSRNSYGTSRILDELTGDLLPRIC